MKKLRIVLTLALVLQSMFGLCQQEFSVNGRLHYGTTIRPNEMVKLFHNKIFIQHTYSDSLGFFSFNELKNGDYRIILNQFRIDSALTIDGKIIDNFWIFLPKDCEVNSEVAQEDIRKGNPKLLLVGGIAPTIVIGQEKFEKKFGVQYYDFGCITEDYVCIREYNYEVFRFLDSEYGKKWRRQVRTDVKFLKEYKADSKGYE
jgi:hypothetical protein